MNATVAAVLGPLTVLTGCLAIYGAYHLARAVAAWAGNERTQRAWDRKTAAAPLMCAEDVPAAEPERQPEPDTYDPRCGTNDELLRACWDTWKATPNRRWEEPK